MSDEYTPDTEHVRDMYVIGELQDDAIDESQHAPFISDFDRWLAAHDAKVKAEAWDEGYLCGYKDAGRERDYDPGWNNPYLN